MKTITSENVKVFSSIFHGVFAGAVVFALLVQFWFENTREILILWTASVACASYLGWILGSWYVPIKGGRLFFEPYVVTPIISLLSAIFSGVVFMLAMEKGLSSGGLLGLGNVLASGFVIGMYAFVLTLPVTAAAGCAVALYFYKFGGYKSDLRKNEEA